LGIDALELTEARRLFEGEAAALAATTIRNEELDEIESILAGCVKENATHQQGRLADRQFHIAIARATRNSAVTAVIENLWDMRYKSPLCAYTLERARRADVLLIVAEHQRILAALRKHDPEAARIAMRDHSAQVIEGLLAATESETVEGAPSNAVKQRHEYRRHLAI
jgi:GntR family transcriptional regulator, hexuronate regulon transcriptional repressor